ncbi:MAG: type II secretion system protein [Clostridia bacterium]
MNLKNKKGITLIALVITIVVLLILAGISIQAITQNNLFEQAKKAKNATENSQKEENKTLSEYMDKMNEYIPETLASKVNSGEIAIGAYVKYIPDAIDVNSEEYKTLVSNWGKTYSGSESNSTSNIVQDTTLNWRILDVDEGKVRLISDKPTKNTVYLSGYQGYNNAVYLLDNACKVLYNSNFTCKSQNLKIEDIQNQMIEKDYNKIWEQYGKEYNPNYKKYPIIIEKESKQEVNNTKNWKFGYSEQDELIMQNEEKVADKLKIMYTFWTTKIEEKDLLKPIYKELFFYNNEGNSYSTYWLASRAILSDEYTAGFYIRNVGDYVFGNQTYNIGGECLYNSNAGKYDREALSLRPIVTLNSNIQLDTTKSGEGTESNPFVIK